MLITQAGHCIRWDVVQWNNEINYDLKLLHSSVQSNKRSLKAAKTK